MNCPICESEHTKVFDVRKRYNKKKETYDKVYRRRVCQDCDYRFTSYEFELGQLMEAFEFRIKNPTILDAIRAVLDIEFPAPREKALNGEGKRKGRE